MKNCLAIVPIGTRDVFALSFKEPDQYNRRQTLRAPLVDAGNSPPQRTFTRAKRYSRTLAIQNASQEKLLISTANITMRSKMHRDAAKSAIKSVG